MGVIGGISIRKEDAVYQSKDENYSKDDNDTEMSRGQFCEETFFRHYVGMAVCARSPELTSEPGGRIVGGWRRRHDVLLRRECFGGGGRDYARAKTTVTDLVWQV